MMVTLTKQAQGVVYAYFWAKPFTGVPESPTVKDMDCIYEKSFDVVPEVGVGYEWEIEFGFIVNGVPGRMQNTL